MSLIILPSLFALCLKISIFARYHKSLTRENFALCVFFLAVFFWNLVEVIFLDGNFSEKTNFLLFIAAYCCVIFVVHSYLGLAMEYATPQWKYLPQIKIGLNVLLGFMILSVLFDRGILAGFETEGISLTKIPGERYWIFQTYLLVGVASAIALLVRGMLKLRENISRQRCFIVLLSTLPAAGVAVSVVVLQALGMSVTSTVLQSLGFSLMLGILVYAEETTRLFRMLTFIPFTKERSLHNKLLDQITDCIAVNDDPSNQQPINLKQMMRDFEGSVVEHVLKYYNGNQKLTASALGVSEATLSRRVREASSRQSAVDPDSI